MSDQLFTVSEVARELGLGIEWVEAWLLSAAGPKDAMRGKITVLGLKKISLAAGSSATQDGRLARSPVAGAGPNGGGEGQGPRREDLRVTRANLNPRVALAERENGNEVQVMVRSTAFLKPGMVLRECIEEGVMGWVYLGRLPRTLGEQQHYFEKNGVSA